MKTKDSGFIEKEHTADFSIFVWAKDLETLFVEAARGMLDLMELKADRSSEKLSFQFEIADMDRESLLVNFLSEILFYLESYQFFLISCSFNLSDCKLSAKLEGYKACLPYKEIKAVTYHNLEIVKDSSDYQVTIVFDV